MGRAEAGAMWWWWWWAQCSEQEMAEPKKKKKAEAEAGFVSALFATRPERAFYIIT